MNRIKVGASKFSYSRFPIQAQKMDRKKMSPILLPAPTCVITLPSPSPPSGRLCANVASTWRSFYRLPPSGGLSGRIVVWAPAEEGHILFGLRSLQ